MALHAFLQIGLSFADVGLFNKNTLIAHKRFYIAKEPLTSTLKKFWSEHGTPSEIDISSRLLEKILEAKLGGTVAQVVTSGFETWPILRQPVLPARFHLTPSRKEPLASQELIFGLSERINEKGQVLKALSDDELEFINTKLKLMGVKRVCVNLLHANRNPEHQNKAAAYFKEQGFEVLVSERGPDSRDEMPAWRRNVMNACLAGAFSEHAEEIQKSLPNPETPIYFLNHVGERFLEDKNQVVGSLFASIHSLAQNLKAEADQVLYLGIENWFLISTQNRFPYWESPWGFIESSVPKFCKLKIQPSTEITNGQWGGVSFSNNELGFEPGPMSFGRALKPTVFDLLNETHSLNLSPIQEQGVQKFRTHINALIKNVPELEKTTFDKLTQSLLNHVVTTLAMECQFQSPEKTKRTILTGPFAPFFHPLLRKKWFDSELILDPISDLRKLHSLAALRGSFA